MKLYLFSLAFAVFLSSTVFAAGDGKPKGTLGFSTRTIVEGPDFDRPIYGGTQIRVRGQQATEIASSIPSNNVVSIFSKIDCSNVPDYGGHPGTYDPDNKLCDSVGPQIGVIKRLPGTSACYQDFVKPARSTCLFDSMENYHSVPVEPVVLYTVAFGPSGANAYLKDLINRSPIQTKDGKVELIFRYIGLKNYGAEVLLLLK